GNHLSLHGGGGGTRATRAEAGRIAASHVRACKNAACPTTLRERARLEVPRIGVAVSARFHGSRNSREEQSRVGDSRASTLRSAAQTCAHARSRSIRERGLSLLAATRRAGAPRLLSSASRGRARSRHSRTPLRC